MKTILPPGEYYIGDPCYVISDNHDTWMEYVQEIYENVSPVPYKYFKDKKIFCHGTAYGDGVYFDQFDNNYGVDAGLIGATPTDICEIKKDDKNIKDLVVVHNFKKEFECFYEKGIFYIGHFKIDTN